MGKDTVQNVNVIVLLSLSFFNHRMKQLTDCLPPESHKLVQSQLAEYDNLSIRLVKPRKRILGNYFQDGDSKHIITLNENLAPYAMLLVLIHELAHLETRLKYGKKVSSHGKEWKQIYSSLLKNHIYENIFPKQWSEIVFLHAQKPCATFPKTLDFTRQ